MTHCRQTHRKIDPKKCAPRRQTNGTVVYEQIEGPVPDQEMFFLITESDLGITPCMEDKVVLEIAMRFFEVMVRIHNSALGVGTSIGKNNVRAQMREALGM